MMAAFLLSWPSKQSFGGQAGLDKKLLQRSAGFTSPYLVYRILSPPGLSEQIIKRPCGAFNSIWKTPSLLWRGNLLLCSAFYEVSLVAMNPQLLLTWRLLQPGGAVGIIALLSNKGKWNGTSCQSANENRFQRVWVLARPLPRAGMLLAASWR